MPHHLHRSFTALSLAASLALPVSAWADEAADLVRTFYAAVDAKDRDAYAAMIADGFEDHDRPATAPVAASDAQVMLNLFSELATGFPMATHTLDFVEPIGSCRAMVRWTFEGRHTGPFFGIPASGNAISISGIDVFTVQGGKFVEQWHVEELADLFVQIGAR